MNILCLSLNTTDFDKLLNLAKFSNYAFLFREALQQKYNAQSSNLSKCLHIFFGILMITCILVWFDLIHYSAFSAAKAM